MNENIAIFLLAVIQGIAEWLPISSSGHLIIFSRIFDYSNDLSFFAALHFGTLMAVFVYFGEDIVNILRDLLSLKFKTKDGRLGLLLIVATLPAALAGYFLNDILENSLQNLAFLAGGWAITSLILFIGSRAPVVKNTTKKEMSFGSALIIGCAQSFSLLRGISRSGTTIVSGLWTGLSEKEAVKFSFLLSIPIVFGANILSIGSNALPREFLWASLVAFATSLAFIHISFKYILSNRKNLLWLGIYTLLMAIGTTVYLIIY